MEDFNKWFEDIFQTPPSDRDWMDRVIKAAYILGKTGKAPEIGDEDSTILVVPDSRGGNEN